MESSLFKYILRHSGREQITLLVLTVASFPVLYFSLDLPKLIVNRAIGGSVFPRTLFGYPLEQIPYLLSLCMLFLALVVINGLLKYVNNVYQGVVGERMLRRLRYQLFHNVLRFPLPHFRHMSQGEIIAMITGETEQLGGFIGESIAVPAFQGGTLLTILGFMFVQDWKLGLAAVALYPAQMVLIPRLQRRVNALRKRKVVRVRKLSERIGEVVSGIGEVHGHDTSRYELAEFSARVGELYHILFDIYRWKYLIKFLNNFVAQLTPFFFYSIGGWLVIRGDLTFGALVAVLTAYKDLSSPWRELLDYYQAQADARIKYELLVSGFQPPGLFPESKLHGQSAEDTSLLGSLVATALDLRDEGESEQAFDGLLNLRLEFPGRVALLGAPGSGQERFAAIVAGLRQVQGGTLTMNGVNLLHAPEALTGRRIAFVGQDSRLRAGTLRENLQYVLLRSPVVHAPRPEADRWRFEARQAGNSEDPIEADWVDYACAGVDGPQALEMRLVEVLRLADLDTDVYALGLQSPADPSAHPEVAERILEARGALRAHLAEPRYAQLVEPFDRARYNTNLSVAENLLFGTPRDPSFAAENLAANAYVRKVLHEAGLMEDFLGVGQNLAALMVDLFADVAPDSELFEQFSFIRAEDLPGFRSLVARAEAEGASNLSQADRIRLLALPFKLVVARHRLGLLDESFQQRILVARRHFAEGFGAGAPPVDFFEPEGFNVALSLQDNILFGRPAYGRARAASVVGELIATVVEELSLRELVIRVGLESQVGVGGARLSVAQRTKVGIARALLKRPEVLVIDDATAGLEPSSEARILSRLSAEFEERALIWVMQRASLAEHFDHVAVFANGTVRAQGGFDELRASEHGPLAAAMAE